MQQEHEEHVSPANESIRDISGYENETAQDVNVTENETDNSPVFSIELERPPFV